MAIKKFKELESVLEKKKALIMIGFLKIQGKAAILVKNMRTTVSSSNRSTGKLEKIKHEIEEVEKNGSNSKADFRELYKEVVACLAVKESGTFKQELKAVTGEAQKCYKQMEELGDEIDCQLVTNKSIKSEDSNRRISP